MIIRLRLLLIILGVIAFTVAQQSGREWLRWVGIALVAVAMVLRFVKR